MSNAPSDPTPGPPEQKFSHENWTRNFLRVVLRFSLVVGLALLVISVLSAPRPGVFALFLLMYVLVLVANFAPLPYRVRGGILAMVIYILGIGGLIEYGMGGDARLYFVIYTILIALFFGWRPSLVAIGTVLLGGLVVGILVLAGAIRLTHPAPDENAGIWAMGFLGIVLLALLINYGLKMVFEEFRNARERAELTVSLLSEERASLELRVDERTAELERGAKQSQKLANQMQAITQVVQQATLEKDIEKMLPGAAVSISEKLGFYHIGIFLLDQDKEYAVLQASNSPGGQNMLARQHRIKIGEAGIVAYAVTMNRARIALDVSSDAYFTRNPDLPDTRAEMALPLSIGERVLGVLDVQSTDPAAFTEGDVEVMKTLADQLALAIENARLLDETRRALAETESLYREYLSSRWGQTGQDTPLGYRYRTRQVAPLQEPVNRPEIQQAAQSGTLALDPKGATAVAVPVKVRDQTIGVINIRSGKAGKRFSPEEIEFLQSISERLGLSLETARLFDAAQKRAAKERMIGGISTRISETSDIDSILQVAAEEIGRALAGSEVVVQLASE